MKKPLLLLQGAKNKFTFLLFIILFAIAIMLTIGKDESLAVFANKAYDNDSLYGIVAGLV